MSKHRHFLWRGGGGADRVTLGTGTNSLDLEGANTRETPANGMTAGNRTVSLSGSSAAFTNAAGGAVLVTGRTTGSDSVTCFTPGTLIATSTWPGTA